MDILGLLPQFGGLIWTLIAFVIALSVIVAIHEYGHYIVGRWTGIKADVFSLGFGPVLWSGHDKHGTKWQIAALPFGGYVKFAGDANAASGKDEAAMAALADDPQALRHTMHGAPLWARALTVAAGPVFNFALSILVFFGVAMSVGVQSDPLTIENVKALPEVENGLKQGDEILSVAGIALPGKDDAAGFARFAAELPKQTTLDYLVNRDGSEVTVTGPFWRPPNVNFVQPRTAAHAAGLKVDDVILAINGQDIYDFEQIRDVVEPSGGDDVTLKVWRAGDVFELTMTPKVTDERQEDGSFVKKVRIGIAGGSAFEWGTQTPGIGYGLQRGVAKTWEIIEGSISGLTNMIVGRISACNLSGPVGIAQISGAMASDGLQSFIHFIAVLSTAVGLINLFPIPILDGGHLVFYAYEAVRGKPPSDGALRVLMTIGLALVLTMMLIGLSSDLFC